MSVKMKAEATSNLQTGQNLGTHITIQISDINIRYKVLLKKSFSKMYYWIEHWILFKANIKM